MSDDKKSLVILAQESARIEMMLAESGGELTPQLEEMLAEIDIKLPQKVENYSLLMERMDALALHYNERASMLLKMSTAAKSVIERCKQNLKQAMINMQAEEIYGVDVRFKLQNNPPSVFIEDEKAIDGAYTVVVPQTIKIDKNRIKEDLKMGMTVKGARLEVGQSIRQYANTPGRK